VLKYRTKKCVVVADQTLISVHTTTVERKNTTITRRFFAPAEPDGFDFLGGGAEAINAPELESLARLKRQRTYGTDFWKEISEKLTRLEDILTGQPRTAWSVDSSSGAIQIGLPGEGAACRDLVQDLIEQLHPWRKGPFQVGDTMIDAEWRSWMKWNRIAPHLPDLRGKTVADIGCNNGYYLFRLAALGARAVWGCDPTDRFFFQYSLLQVLVQEPRIFFEPFGVEDCTRLPMSFDLVLCLGVIYHRRDPLGMLEDIRRSLKKNGQAIIESIVMPEVYFSDQQQQCLFVTDRYQMMRNVYFLPSASLLAAWMKRVGFSSVEILDDSQTTIEEQRSTPHARFLSLQDTLSPTDPTRTIEGFPAPRRAIVRGFA
jgi:tRNA (mo5U34)-methyltransferase